MREILFEEGPLLGEITSCYRPDEVLPVLGQRYHWEISDVFGSHGYSMTGSVLPIDPETTLDEAIKTLALGGYKIGEGAQYGPVVDEEGRIRPGLGIWERTRKAGGAMLSVA